MRRPLVATAVVLLLVGCSGDGPEPVVTLGPPSPTPAPAVVALMGSVEAYGRAFLTGDGRTAHGLLSRRCRVQHPLDELVDRAEQAENLYGYLPLRDDWEVDLVDATHALVTYGYVVRVLDQHREPWVLEGGTWRNDDC